MIMVFDFTKSVQLSSPLQSKMIKIKERKSKYQQKVLKFKKSSLFSQNLFIESRFLNGSAAPLATIQFLKLFISDTNQSEEFQKCEVKKLCLSVNCYPVCFLSIVENFNSVC